jgi:Fe-S-cluster containining protein
MAEVSCDNCVAACCRAGQSIMLNALEYQQHRRAMTLKRLLKAESHRQEVAVDMWRVDEKGKQVAAPGSLSIPPHHGFYVFLTDCGNLGPCSQEGAENRRCGVYDDRPGACRRFEMGSEACLSTRAKYGLDGHEARDTLQRGEPLRFKGWQQLN